MYAIYVEHFFSLSKICVLIYFVVVFTVFFKFKVLHSGCWQKINFKRTKPQLLEENESSTDILSNPWIRHFRPTSKKQGLDCSLLEYDVNISEAIDSEGKKSSSISNGRSNLCHQSWLDSKAGSSQLCFGCVYCRKIFLAWLPFWRFLFLFLLLWGIFRNVFKVCLA